jgi:hypothetical protein
MARKGGNLNILVGVVVILSICLGTMPSKAYIGDGDYDIDIKLGPGETALAVLLCCTYGYLTIGGLIIGFANFSYATKGEQATPGWRIQGWIVGGLNLVMGATVIGLVLQEPTVDDVGLTIGMISIGVGVLDIGFTIWSSSQPESKKSLTVNPIVMQDVEGNPAVGVGLNLVNW